MSAMRPLLKSLLFACATLLPAEEAIVELQIQDGPATYALADAGPLTVLIHSTLFTATDSQLALETLMDFHSGEGVITYPGAGVAPRVGMRGNYGPRAAAAVPMWQSLSDRLRAVLPGVSGYAVQSEATLITWSDTAPLPWPTVTPNDASVHLHLQPAIALDVLGPLARKTSAALHISTWDGEVRFVPQGSREQFVLRGQWPTLPAIDYAALHDLKREALAGFAIGLDGTAIEQWVFEIGDAFPELTLGLATVDDYLLRLGYPSLSDVLFTLDGTAWITVMPGAPLPLVTLRLPATATLDSFADALLTAFGVDAAATRTQAQPLPMPGNSGFPVMVRRASDGWLLSTDTAGLDTLVEAHGAPFDNSGFAALAGDQAPVAIAWSDTRTVLRTMMSSLPVLMQRVPPAERQLLTKMIPEVIKIAEGLPAMQAAVSQTPGAFQVRSDNAFTSTVACGGIAAVVAWPRLQANRVQNLQGVTSQRMKLLIQTCSDWSIDHDGHFPPDLTQLAQDVPDVEPNLHSAFLSDDAPLPHYLYVLPAAEPMAWQPVILEDPNHHPDGVLIYATVNAAVHSVRGNDAQKIWREAQRVAGQNPPPTHGATGQDWESVRELLDR